MDDLDKYIKKRKGKSFKFSEDFDKGYEQFKVGVLLKQARLEAGYTQEQVAKKLHTKKPAQNNIKYFFRNVYLSVVEQSDTSRLL